MLKLRIETNRIILGNRFSSLQASSESSEISKSKSFQNTVFLPKTNFPNYLKPKQVIERDKKIQQEAKFLDLYSWQRENLKGNEFVFHDGPPYANGKPHIGHAINKIMKDIILRTQLIQGNRVYYIPGWDCHGLPIEMIALKNHNSSTTPINIRKKARDLATSMSKIQMEAFKNWGVIGDWESQCYYTYDPKYVVNQLQLFWKFYEKGLIYHSLKPVFWSPSSQTALAESELIYKNHESESLIVRFEISQEVNSEPMFLLIWTTTPWTLPLNKAVYFSKNHKYSIVKISSIPGLYIVATDLIDSLKQKLKKEIKEHSAISCEELIKLNYKHPWKKTKIMKIFESSDVKLFGTGLVHLVPGLSHEDYNMSLKHNLEVESFIDEKGCYTSEMGPDLSGLYVLNEGSKYITQNLSTDILNVEKLNHVYPYDWRTNEPVIIRASKQWFIDCDQIKSRAMKILNKSDISLKHFQTRLQNRPYWCLSRQRCWGVPIPAFFHKTSGRPLISKNLIDHLCYLFECFGPDIWWSGEIKTLFPKKACQELYVNIEDVFKGEDIMDIWFDSGISWSFVLNGKKSELVLEGVDQYEGWFQSSLLTSVAIQGTAPFKSIMVHGFAVDENGKKMSKSLGNVVDPNSVTQGDDALGIDTLRWWVGSHSHQNLVTASKNIFMTDYESVTKIRKIFRFLLGALNGISEESLESGFDLTFLDRYILNKCYEFYTLTINLYNVYNIASVCRNLIHFVSNDISSGYISLVKDRLYCDMPESSRRRACLFTINGIFHTLSHTIAPILPHLAEEVYNYHPLYNGQRKLFYSYWSPPVSWKDSSADIYISIINEIRQEILFEKQLSKMSCCIEIEEEKFKLLKEMQNEKKISIDSELTENLQVAEVQLKIGQKNVVLSPSQRFFCLRCRRYTANKNNELCSRCETVISNSVSEIVEVI